MKILVVEDTEDSRIMLVDLLEAQGYEVDSAVNGVEALEKSLTAPPDVIVSDILMPEMDGFELCHRLKIDPRLKKIPFIFYTATYTEDSDRDLALSMGATRFIIKPEDPVKLLKIIEEVIADNHETVFAPLSESPDELETKRAEAVSRKLNKKVSELEEQKEQLRIITDAMPALIAEIDQFGHYKYINKAYEKCFHTSCNKIVGNSIRDVVGDEGFKVIQPYMERALKGEEVTFEEYIPDCDGNRHYIQAHYIPRRKKDKTSNGFFSFTYDLTDRKLAEEERLKLSEQLRQAQKMESIGHLVGGISHDFNNLLATVLGFVELARMCDIEDKSGRLDGYLENIQMAGKRATDLVAQLMVFTHQTGKSIKSSIDIKPVIKEVIRLIKETFPATISINVELDKSISTIDVDPVQLHQVIMNLCVNARDAIEGHGQITIKLDHEQVSEALCDSCKQDFNGDFVTLSFKDDGAGIEPEHLEHIFESFYTTKEVGKGTGFGLSTVHDIVHEVGGHIQLESEVGKGTTFRMFFPVSTQMEGAVDENSDDEDICENEGDGFHLMVVDDEHSIARYLEELLTMCGYQVTMFTDSQNALEALQKTPDAYDLIISDQTMPIMTGLEMAQKMLQLHPDLPVIICSGYSDSLTETNAKMAGVKAVLYKPIDTNRLLQEICRLVGQ